MPARSFEEAGGTVVEEAAPLSGPVPGGADISDDTPISRGDLVVIGGVSCRLPQSDNMEEFKVNLMTGVDMVTEDDSRWEQGLHGLSRRSGKLKDLSKFDASFFGVHPKQANCMDPQLRLLLEVTYEAIIDAGYDPSELGGSNTGVFIGASASESHEAWSCDPDTTQGYTMTGCTRSMFSNRLSYFFDFKGPSYTIDTACSSSLLALDQAVNSIRSGQCEAAIVGGSNLCLKPTTALQFLKLGMLSPEGICKSFDANGNGYVRSEGVVALYLQKHSTAKRVYCTVLHSKTNSDGHKQQGITFPSGECQKKLLQDLYSEAGIDPVQVAYMEAHGTGTKAGDPQEVNTICDFFCKGRSGALKIGSVKSNMGHSEPASVSIMTANFNSHPCVVGRARQHCSAHNNLVQNPVVRTPWFPLHRTRPSSEQSYSPYLCNKFNYGGENYQGLFQLAVICQRCGASCTDHHMCPAISRKCYLCRRYGHYASLCKTKHQQLTSHKTDQHTNKLLSETQTISSKTPSIDNQGMTNKGFLERKLSDFELKISDLQDKVNQSNSQLKQFQQKCQTLTKEKAELAATCKNLSDKLNSVNSANKDQERVMDKLKQQLHLLYKYSVDSQNESHMNLIGLVQVIQESREIAQKYIKHFSGRECRNCKTSLHSKRQPCPAKGWKCFACDSANHFTFACEGGLKPSKELDKETEKLISQLEKETGIQTFKKKILASRSARK